MSKKFFGNNNTLNRGYVDQEGDDKIYSAPLEDKFEEKVFNHDKRSMKYDISKKDSTNLNSNLGYLLLIQATRLLRIFISSIVMLLISYLSFKIFEKGYSLYSIIFLFANLSIYMYITAKLIGTSNYKKPKFRKINSNKKYQNRFYRKYR